MFREMLCTDFAEMAALRKILFAAATLSRRITFATMLTAANLSQSYQITTHCTSEFVSIHSIPKTALARPCWWLCIIIIIIIIMIKFELLANKPFLSSRQILHRECIFSRGWNKEAHLCSATDIRSNIAAKRGFIGGFDCYGPLERSSPGGRLVHPSRC